MEVLRYSVSNTVMWSKYAIGIMFNSYPGLPHMLSLSRSLVQTLCGMTHKVVSFHKSRVFLCPPKCTLMAFFPWWKAWASIHCLSVYHPFARMLNTKRLCIMITCLTFCSAIKESSTMRGFILVLILLRSSMSEFGEPHPLVPISPVSYSSSWMRVIRSRRKNWIKSY